MSTSRSPLRYPLPCSLLSPYELDKTVNMEGDALLPINAPANKQTNS